MKKPNILFIMNDQHRFDRLGCMSDPLIKTPHVDRIAREGVTFTNAYCPSPVCGPARGAIFSGMYPPACGVVNNWVPFRGDIVLLTERLQQLGYRTAEVGKLHFVPHIKRFGFQFKRLHDAHYNVYANDALYSDYVKYLQETRYRDDPEEPIRRADEDEACYWTGDEYRFIMGSNWLEEKYHYNTWTAEESIKYLQNYQGDEPFFLFVSFFGPHQPFEPPTPWNTLYDPEDIELPPQFYAGMEDAPVFQATKGASSREHKTKWNEATYKKIIAAYYGQITMIDHYIGRIFAQLEAMGLWDETMIIFTADHGDHNGQYGLFYKGDMYDSCEKVPLIIKPAFAQQGGWQNSRVVNTIDLFGTILEVAGDQNWAEEEAEKGRIEARSLAPLLHKGAEVAWENHTFAIIGGNPESNLTMLRQDHLKLIRLAREDGEALYELYDMRDPVYEVRNVYEDPTYAAQREELKEKLDRWWARQKALYPQRVKSYVKER
ncbi:MAG: sulfatase-like hydrolase/transferase [Anaerolineae bacterium]|nr:sulfatase-like hydrolase/transferase [Anaerolineae bacterium]